MNKKPWRIIAFLITLTTLVTMSCMCGGLGDKLPDVEELIGEEIVSEALEEAGLPMEELEDAIDMAEQAMTEESVELPDEMPVEKPEDKPDNPPAQPIDPPDTSGLDVELGEWMRSDEGGFAYYTIPGYSHEAFWGLAEMHAPEYSTDTGPMVMLIGEEVEEDVKAEEFFEATRGELEEEETIRVNNKRTMQVDGAPGFVGDIVGTYEGVAVGGRLTTVVVKGRHQFTMVGVSPEAEWKDLLPYYEAVQKTIKFFPPTEGDSTDSTDSADPSDFSMEMEQFAFMAEASSQYGEPSWSADQATGEPDVTECGDNVSAWASASYTSVDWIELTYVLPVIPTRVTVYQSYTPDQVVKIELKDVDGNYHEIYSGKPEAKDTCPYLLVVDVEGADYETDVVKVTVDQSVLGDWNEIDAVQLVGAMGEE